MYSESIFFPSHIRVNLIISGTYSFIKKIEYTPNPREYIIIITPNKKGFSFFLIKIDTATIANRLNKAEPSIG